MLAINTLFSKVPRVVGDLLPKNGLFITFISYYSYRKAKNSSVDYREFDYIALDGSFAVWLYNLFSQKKAVRMSFDMTSIAPLVFSDLIKKRGGLYIIGSTCQSIHDFVEIIQSNYRDLLIFGYSSGYFENEEMMMQRVDEIINTAPDVVLIGMGAPLQDKFALLLKKNGYNGTVYTCGGFIHQTTKALNYYPRVIDKLNMRVFYRMVREPYVIKRIVPGLAVFFKDWLYYKIKKVK